MGYPVSTSTQTEYLELLSPVLYSSLYPDISLPISTSLVLVLKACDSQELGLMMLVPITCLCYSFRLDQSHVLQGSLELTETRLSLPPKCWD